MGERRDRGGPGYVFQKTNLAEDLTGPSHAECAFAAIDGSLGYQQLTGVDDKKGFGGISLGKDGVTRLIVPEAEEAFEFLYLIVGQPEPLQACFQVHFFAVPQNTLTGVVDVTLPYQSIGHEPCADDFLKRLPFAFRCRTVFDRLARRHSAIAGYWSHAPIHNN
jgi:hypothetical protein